MQSLICPSFSIASLEPHPPQNIFFVKESRRHNEIWITWNSPKRNKGTRYLIGFFSPIIERTASIQSETELRSMFFQVATNLKSNTVYIFRVFAVNFNGRVSLPSEELEVETKIHPFGCTVIASHPALSQLASVFGIHYCTDKYADFQEPSDSPSED